MLPSICALGIDLLRCSYPIRSAKMKRRNLSIVVVALALCPLVFSACGQQMTSSRTHVILGIYSGRPDPSWSLTVPQSSQLEVLISGLKRVRGHSPTGALGYHGFTIVSKAGTMVAFDGTVVKLSAKVAYYWSDPRRSVETFLIATASGHVPLDVLDAVTRTLR